MGVALTWAWLLCKGVAFTCAWRLYGRGSYMGVALIHVHDLYVPVARMWAARN